MATNENPTLTLQDLGNIGELVGAIGVIASLVYLAIQIRQNTAQMEQSSRSLRAAAYQDLLHHLANVTLTTVDSEVAELLDNGRQDYSALSRVDQSRWRAIIHSFFRNYENAYYQHREGLIDDVQWESLSFAIAGQVAYPGVIQWWAKFKGAFGEPFRELVESLISEK